MDEHDTIVWVYGSQNGRSQIVYQVTGSTNYKLGWVDTTVVLMNGAQIEPYYEIADGATPTPYPQNKSTG